MGDVTSCGTMPQDNKPLKKITIEEAEGGYLISKRLQKYGNDAHAVVLKENLTEYVTNFFAQNP